MILSNGTGPPPVPFLSAPSPICLLEKPFVHRKGERLFPSSPASFLAARDGRAFFLLDRSRFSGTCDAESRKTAPARSGWAPGPNAFAGDVRASLQPCPAAMDLNGQRRPLHTLSRMRFSQTALGFSSGPSGIGSLYRSMTACMCQRCSFPFAKMQLLMQIGGFLLQSFFAWIGIAYADKHRYPVCGRNF